MILGITINVRPQSPIQSFTLTNNKSEKIVKCASHCYLEFKTIEIPLAIGDSIRQLQGDILTISKNYVTIAPNIDITKKRYPFDSVQYLEKRQREPNYHVNLNIPSIEKISYQTNNSLNWEAIGYSTIIIGGLTSLFVAPLISINYKNGGFNANRYITCASIGLGLITIGIPIAVCNKVLALI